MSLFCDEDMVVTGDIHELFDSCGNPDWDVAVMKDQPRFEWPSVMVFNNERCKNLTPEFIDDESNAMYDFAWADSIGEIPFEWNHCVGYQEPKVAKLYHYTQGIPYWHECQGLQEDPYWFEAYDAMLKSANWIDLHRNTHHFQPVIKRMLARYGVQARPVA